MTEMRGPFSPSVNAECGLLVEGFDTPPVVMTPYNPPTYPELVEWAGHRPLKDLHAYLLQRPGVRSGLDTMKRIDRLASAIRKRHPHIAVRTLDMARYQAETKALGDLFNAVRRNNWGFVPVTDAESADTARDMKLIVDPEMIVLAEDAGQLVGCLLAVPDLNPLLKKCNGRLLPLGWLRLLWGRRRLRGLRVFGAAVAESHRNFGIAPLLFSRFIANGQRRGYQYAELSWVSEDNLASLRTIERALRPQLYKRFRIYTADL